MTISLVAVFIPVLFMGGIVGRLLHEFSVTIVVAILISGFVSLSLTPMLGSRFLKHDHGVRHGLLYRTLEGGFNGMQRLVRGHAAASPCASGWSRLRSPSRCCSARSTCSRRCRPASFPARTAASCSPPRWARRMSRSIRWQQHNHAAGEIRARAPGRARTWASSSVGGNQAFMFARMKPREPAHPLGGPDHRTAAARRWRPSPA